MQLHGSSTGATTGPTQITHVSLSILPPPRAAVASRLSVACRAPQARLCDFQCFFWHGFPQYQARWHCEQHIILAPSDWQWKQRWVSGAALAFLPLPLPLLGMDAMGGRVSETPWASTHDFPVAPNHRRRVTRRGRATQIYRETRRR